MIAEERQTDSEMIDSIIERVMENPSGVVASILPKLSDSTQSETALIVYAWVLGWTQDPLVIEPLVVLAKDSDSDWVKINCLHSLVMIDGQKSGEGVVSILDSTNDKELRYEMLNILAAMQYEPALPIMG